MSEGKQILQLILDEMKLMRERTDESDTRLDSIDKTLIVQEAHLAEHIKRTALLEQRAEKIELDIQPIKQRMIQFDGLVKFFGLLGGVVLFIVAVIEFLRAIK